MTRIVVFDFDGTLIKGDSFIGFASRIFGKLAVAKALAIEMFVLVGWQLRFVDNGYAKERVFSRLFKGITLQQLDSWGESFIADLEARIRPEIMCKLEEHQKKGDKIYIISASLLQWIRPWAKCHGIKNILSTEPEIDRMGILTGRFATQNCYGEEKVRRLLEAEPERDGYNLIVYGDSKGDFDLFAIADRFERV